MIRKTALEERNRAVTDLFLTLDPETFWANSLAPGSQLSTYPDFREKSESVPEGTTELDSFAQIDGSTGQPCLSSYIHTEGKDVHWIFKHYNGNAHDFSMRHKIQTKAQGVDLGRISLCLHAYQRQLQGNNKA